MIYIDQSIHTQNNSQFMLKKRSSITNDIKIKLKWFMSSYASVVGRNIIFFGICVEVEKISVVLISPSSKCRERMENFVLGSNQLIKILIAFFIKVLTFTIFLH